MLGLFAHGHSVEGGQAEAQGHPGEGQQSKWPSGGGTRLQGPLVSSLQS